MAEQRFCKAKVGGSTPLSGSKTELKGFLEAQIWDARSAFHISVV